MPEIDEGALVLADHAFIETQGSNAQKVQAAVWAYLWALENPRTLRPGNLLSVYPSLEELREALGNRS